ncbi:YbjQ family protein [Haliangium sp.]|uniref:YbjQ family protein n=1 Tax=Haliangium sp. TaxID=2663208 RepID=UPI003D13288D
MEIIIFIALFLLGLVAGTAAERRHLRALDERERAAAQIFVTDLKRFPHPDPTQPGAELVVAEVVIASDYFKTFVAGLIGLVGGEMRTYRLLLERGRREALQRLREQAGARGYNALANVRIEAADLGGNAVRQRMPMASILASGTAYHALPGVRPALPPAP